MADTPAAGRRRDESRARLRTDARGRARRDRVQPFTIVYWTAAFGAIVPELGLSRLQATTLLPTGVLTGTLVWGTALAGGASWAGRYVEERLLDWITLASALTIAAFGAWFVAGGVRALA